MKAFDYATATTVEAAIAAAGKGYKYKAGGIDVVDMMKERIERADKLVSINGVGGLRGIRATGSGGVEIGALSTLAEIGDSPLLRERFAAMAQTCASAATPQVRAVATAAGNLCQRPRCWYYRLKEYYCLKKGGGTCYAVEGENHYHALFGGGPCHIVHPSNIAPVLVAMKGSVAVRNAGVERRIGADDFFALPSRSMYAENVLEDGDLVTALEIPAAPRKSAWVDLKERQSFDWPLAAAAVALNDDGWRVVLGAAAPIPWRAEAAEELLGNAATITPELAERAADAALQGAEPMSQNAWRLKLVRASVRRALLLADGKDIDA